MNERKKLGKNIFVNLSTSIVLILSFSFLLFPVYWILTMALKTNPDILTYPPKFIFQPVIKGFQYILGLVEVVGATGVSAGVESWFLVGIKNSIIVVVSTILISLAVGGKICINPWAPLWETPLLSKLDSAFTTALINAESRSTLFEALLIK